MEQRVAIVTGGLRGLGRAMAFGLAREGHNVVAVGHIDADIAEVEAETAGAKPEGQILPLVADLRRPADCDRVVARRGAVWPAAHPRQQCRPDLHDDRPGALPAGRAAEILAGAGRHRRDVIETNILAADQMARRVAPLMVEQGWGRIVNVTTKLDTMNRPRTTPTAPPRRRSKWRPRCGQRRPRGTGLTINIVNPGAGANTPGMAEEMRAMSREGRAPRLVEPDEMVPPLLYVVSREADSVNG